MPSSADGARRRIPWRRFNNAIHRDVGYAAVALTLIDAISGIAVNPIHDWNPSYRFVRESNAVHDAVHTF